MLITHTPYKSLFFPIPYTHCINPPLSLPGAGHGRVLSGKGGIRPSYQAADSIPVELPSYPVPPEQHKDTQKRMGFTW